MKKLITAIILTAVLVLNTGCGYTLYGAAMGSPKNNELESMEPPQIFPADSYEGEYPRSIIYIIADGTGIGQYTLSYYANGDFAPARFEHVGLVTTQPDDNRKKVTDSAASGTALATGNKTYNGAVSVDHEKEPLKTVVEWAEEKGMATGLVATSTISHATPATFGAHIDYRKKEQEISRQLAESSIDVLFGGGRKYWEGELFDLVKKNGGQVINDIQEPVSPGKRVVGLFAESGLPAVYEGREPSTVEMTKKAVQILENDPDGFFLMVEESQVDWGGHANSAEYVRGEMQSLNDVVNFCLDYQRKHPNVLVVLTADHETGGLAVHDTPEKKLDIRFTHDYHSANFVPIWATGPGSAAFDAFIDNTEVGKTLIKYVKK